MNILLRLLRPLARATGLSARIHDGRFIPDPSICIPNFLFQRILGVNRACKWPVHYTSRVMFPQNIVMGRHVGTSFAVSGGCYIQAMNGIILEDYVLFGPGVRIVSANHDPADLHNAWLPAHPIRIGRHTLIGANAVILPGVSLGDRVIVGAGAIVTKSFPSNVVIAGNPAKIIRSTTDNPHFTKEALQWSNPIR